MKKDNRIRWIRRMLLSICIGGLIMSDPSVEGYYGIESSMVMASDDSDDYDYIEIYEGGNEANNEEQLPEEAPSQQNTSTAAPAHVKDVTPKTQDKGIAEGYVFSVALFLAGMTLVILSHKKRGR